MGCFGSASRRWFSDQFPGSHSNQSPSSTPSTRFKFNNHYFKYGVLRRLMRASVLRGSQLPTLCRSLIIAAIRVRHSQQTVRRCPLSLVQIHVIYHVDHVLCRYAPPILPVESPYLPLLQVTICSRLYISSYE